MRSVDSRTGQYIYSGSAAVIDGVTQVPRHGVTGTVDGVGSVSIMRYVGASQPLAQVRATVNPGTDVNAANRLSDGYPDVMSVAPDGDLTITSDSDITDLYLTAVNVHAAIKVDDQLKVALDGTNLGDSIPQTYTAAQIINNASMVHFRFSAADAVRTVTISVGATTSTNYNLITVGGFSHA